MRRVGWLFSIISCEGARQGINLIVLVAKRKVAQLFQQSVIPVGANNRKITCLDLRCDRCSASKLGPGFARSIYTVSRKLAREVAGLVLTRLAGILR